MAFLSPWGYRDSGEFGGLSGFLACTRFRRHRGRCLMEPEVAPPPSRPPSGRH